MPHAIGRLSAFKGRTVNIADSGKHTLADLGPVSTTFLAKHRVEATRAALLAAVA